MVPGEIMMKANMDYDSLKAAGSSVGSAAVIVMDESTCMVRTLRAIVALLHVGILRPVHAVPRRHRLADAHAQADHRRAGRRASIWACCSMWPTASRGTRSARSAMRRPGRCRASSSIIRHEFEFMIDHGGRSIVDSGRPGGGVSAEFVNIEVNGVAVKAPQGRDDHSRDRCERRLHSALLLSRQAADRGQLPHVPGRGREGPEADAGLRHAGRRGHEDLHALAQGDRARRKPRWSSC